MKYVYIYLAGQMTGISFEESNIWRETAKEYLESRDTDYFVKVINPNNYYNFKEKRHESEKEIIRFDLHKVRNSNLILVNLNGNSVGTSMELMHAFDKQIPIIGFKDNKKELHPWLEFLCDRVFDDMKSALSYINDYYLI